MKREWSIDALKPNLVSVNVTETEDGALISSANYYIDYDELQSIYHQAGVAVMEASALREGKDVEQCS